MARAPRSKDLTGRLLGENEKVRQLRLRESSGLTTATYQVAADDVSNADGWYIGSNPPYPSFQLQGGWVLLAGAFEHIYGAGTNLQILPGGTLPPEFRPATWRYFRAHGMNGDNDDREWQVELRTDGQLILANFHNDDAAPPFGNLYEDVPHRVQIHVVYPAASTGLGEYPP